MVIVLPKVLPMEDLRSLIQNEEHEKILQLESPEYSRYKAVAAIHLERYSEALLYAPKGSFELAYIHYKLRNFRKSLKVLRRLSGKKVDILKSQCLYFLGHYSDACMLLSRHGCSDEFAVNLAAMEALASLNNRIKPSLFTSNDARVPPEMPRLKFEDPECLLEGEHNGSFKLVEHEREWVRALVGLQSKYQVENSCIQRQLSNLAEDNAGPFSKREAEILSFNAGKGNAIANPVLFQPNFIANNVKSDYQVFKDYQLNANEYVSGKRAFQPFNNRLRLLKCLIIAKRRPTRERSLRIIKTLEGVEDSLEKRILGLLASELPENELQEQALDLIFQSSENSKLP